MSGGIIKLEHHHTIVFIGDSITDADHNADPYKPFGFGYVHFTANCLLAKYPQLGLNIVNSGISGNTVRDLKSRWERDCLSYKPDVISVLIGINDVWRAHQGRMAEAVDLEEYETTYRNLLNQARQQNNCQLVLMEPFMFCSDTANPMFKSLISYIEVVHRMAEQFGAIVVPLQQRINEQIQEVPAERWSDDMVHPYVWAHAWISLRWLETTGL